ncbi:MAG: sulfite exporter TauE/SafE family protein, partial [Nitrososphaeraceae archaeon]|nr:sulfite exporter TauE/SafE family protein [Nitrososphaeraceae archaeon]
GTFGSMVGVGGGILMIPVLTVLGLEPSQIASTSLIAVTSTGISSTIEYSRQKRIDYLVGLKIAALAIPGAIIGAFLSSYISFEHFKVYFAIILILTGLYIIYRNSILKERRKKTNSKSMHLLFYVGSFTAGIISSLFGIGGGIIFVPLMVILLRVSMFRAGPNSQLALLITSLVGVFTHSLLGHTNYVYGILLAIGALTGGYIGARLSRHVREGVLQILLSTSLIGVAVKLLLDFINNK